jgi:hypothetical protein
MPVEGGAGHAAVGGRGSEMKASPRKRERAEAGAGGDEEEPEVPVPAPRKQASTLGWASPPGPGIGPYRAPRFDPGSGGR